MRCLGLLASLGVYAAAFMVDTHSAHGQCDVSFAPAVSYGAGILCQSVAIGDFDGDSKPDLAVANAGSNNVSVLLGNGDGTFQPAVNYAAGTYPSSVAIADLNHDGRLDLVVANRNSANVSVLLGNGNGSFQPAVGLPIAGGSPTSVVIGELNGDGRPDIVVAGGCAVFVLLGRGDGTFQTAVAFSNNDVCASSVAIGDLNGDGWPDLAVCGITSGGVVSVLPGNGNGTFQPWQSLFSFAGLASSIAIEDFTGDGRPDIVSAGRDTIAIIPGNQDGRLYPNIIYRGDMTRDLPGPGILPSALAVADLNGDGYLDLAWPDLTSGFSIVQGGGNGAFGRLWIPALGLGAGNHVAIKDLNGDGRPDLVIAYDYDPGVVKVLLNTTSRAPVISAQPLNQSVTTGQIAAFSVGVTGDGQFSYQWRRNGAALANGGLFSGVNTGVLTISNVSLAEIGAYDVRVGGGCPGASMLTSNPAALSVAPCRGDFNGDHLFNALDIQAIVDAMLAGESCP